MRSGKKAEERKLDKLRTKHEIASKLAALSDEERKKEGERKLEKIRKKTATRNTKREMEIAGQKKERGA